MTPTTSLRIAGLVTSLLASTLALSACGPVNQVLGAAGSAAGRGIAVAPLAPSEIQAIQPAAVSASQYASARDFKAVARVPSGAVGIGSGEPSLIAAERTALQNCTRASQYRGECEIDVVGQQSVRGLDDASKERVKWRYLRTSHEAQSVRAPVKLRIPFKALLPGSQVVDGNLYLSGDFRAGGYSVIQFGQNRCSGVLDPLEPEGQDPQPNEEPLGIMEYACEDGSVLRGGYVQADLSNQIFFLEDRAAERWDFIASTEAAGVGADVGAFKRLYKKIERGE